MIEPATPEQRIARLETDPRRRERLADARKRIAEALGKSEQEIVNAIQIAKLSHASHAP